jgi:CheY-like chemotaxis protein
VFVGILSALEDDAALADAERYGASAYLAKPFSSLDLQAALQMVTGRPPAIRVLLIDDSRTQRIILRTALTTLESAADLKCEIEEANDGPEGLRMALSGGYDIVFLDINMPGLNGVEVLREIKRAQRRAKVVMLSGAIDEVYETRLTTLGADACLAKPIEITEVLTCVVAMLDVRRPPRRAA